MTGRTMIMLSALAAFAGLCLSPLSHAAFIETINESAVPATPNKPVNFRDGFDGIGWYYTPKQDYTLTGIYSVFRTMGGDSSMHHVTVQIQSERPIQGGAVLAESSFPIDPSLGGMHGASFDPLPLSKSQTYFVDFIGELGGVGLNVGTWETGPDGNHGADGATTNLGVFYTDAASGFGMECADPWGFANDGFTHISGTHPILLFEGFAVPEPVSTLLLAIGGAIILRVNRKATNAVGAGGRT